MKVKSCVFVALASLAAFADPTDPQVALVSAGQDLNRVVTVKYTLDEPAIVTFDVLTNGVSIGAENLKTASGDLWRVVAATGSGEVRTIAWNAYESWPDHKFKNGEVSVKVTAWATNSPPDYMVIKLVGDDKGARTFYTAPEQLPGVGGVTNDMYKTDYLVMRRIPAAGKTFRMGSPASEPARQSNEILHYVSLTNDFYMSVFELTQGQFMNVVGSEPTTYSSYSYEPTHPVDWIVYNSFRGSSALWPNDGHDVDPSKDLYTFRTVLNLPSLDLPTESEWEFACRAGTGTARPDMVAAVGDLAWYADNSDGATHEVGLKLPNPWGLYDMFGNVSEWCRDYAGAYETANSLAAPVIAPTGPATATDSTNCYRAKRGGSFRSPESWIRSARRGYSDQTWVQGTSATDGVSSSAYNSGYRLVIDLD